MVKRTKPNQIRVDMSDENKEKLKHVLKVLGVTQTRFFTDYLKQKYEEVEAIEEYLNRNKEK